MTLQPKELKWQCKPIERIYASLLLHLRFLQAYRAETLIKSLMLRVIGSL